MFLLDAEYYVSSNFVQNSNELYLLIDFIRPGCC